MEATDQWQERSSKRPIPYELVTVLTSTGMEIPAWWTGNAWDGLKMRPDTQVVAWRKEGCYGQWVRPLEKVLPDPRANLG